MDTKPTTSEAQAAPVAGRAIRIDTSKLLGTLSFGETSGATKVGATKPRSKVGATKVGATKPQSRVGAAKTAD